MMEVPLDASTEDKKYNIVTKMDTYIDMNSIHLQMNRPQSNAIRPVGSKNTPRDLYEGPKGNLSEGHSYRGNLSEGPKGNLSEGPSIEMQPKTSLKNLDTIENGRMEKDEKDETDPNGCSGCTPSCLCVKKMVITALPIIGFGIALAVKTDLVYNLGFFLSMWGIVSLFAFIMHPKLSRWLHEKPIYYEDLHDEDAPSKKEAKYYQNIFEKIMALPLSLLITAIAWYIFYKFKGSTLSYFEMLGIIGGSLSLFQKFQNVVGNILIFAFHALKKDDQHQRRIIQRSSSMEE